MPASMPYLSLNRFLTAPWEVRLVRETNMARTISSSMRLLRQKKREFSLLIMICFAFFLVAAVIGRVLPGAWKRAVENGNRRHNVFAEAWASVHTFLPFVYQR